MDTLSSHFYDAVCHWLEQKQLGKALEAIRNQLDDIHDWSIAQEYESLCINYRLLLSYFYQGADDPQRQTDIENLTKHYQKENSDIADDVAKQDFINF